MVAADLPIGLVVPRRHRLTRASPRATPARRSAASWRSPTCCAPEARRVRNVVWITADVHYTAAHHYDPTGRRSRTSTRSGSSSSGPLNAGGFGPNALDATFGPEVVFHKAPPDGEHRRRTGYQFFGEVDIDAAAEVLTVSLKDIDGTVLFTQDLDAT